MRMEIVVIKGLIEKGEFDQALQAIAADNLIEYNLEKQLLKTDILIAKGEYDTALTIAKETKEKAREQKNKTIELAAMIGELTVHWKKGKLEESLEILNNCEKFILEMDEVERMESLVWEAQLLNRKGGIEYQTGKIEEALRDYNFGLAVLSDLDDQKGITATLNNIGIIHASQGNYDMAIDFYEKSLKIKEELGNKQDIANSLNNLGNIYRSKGEFVQAFDYHSKALSLREEVGNQQYIAYSLNNVGIISSQIGNLEVAIEYLRKSLAIRSELGNELELASTLYNIIKAYYLHDSIEEVNRYIKQLREIDDTSTNKFIHLYYRMVKALQLKNKPGLQSKYEARQIFEQLIKEEVIDHEITVYAMFNLCELLLNEYKLDHEERKLDEVVNITSRICEFAQNQKSFLVLIEAIILCFKFEMMRRNYSEADALLKQAREITEQNNLVAMSNII
ncbi:MAG: tetratricopeptide repeat protein, partial [Candidatus Kariarchaeaceae archaeon]